MAIKMRLQKLKMQPQAFSPAAGRAESFKVQGSWLRTEKIPDLSRKLPPDSLIMAKTFRDATLTAPLFQRELPSISSMKTASRDNKLEIQACKTVVTIQEN
jgi:hypothetical protein